MKYALHIAKYIRKVGLLLNAALAANNDIHVIELHFQHSILGRSRDDLSHFHIKKSRFRQLPHENVVRGAGDAFGFPGVIYLAQPRLGSTAREGTQETGL